MLNFPLPGLNMSHDDLMLILLIMVVLVLVKSGAFPSIDNIERFAHMLDSRGGNLLILAGMSIWFYIGALRMFYRIIDMVAGKQLTPENAPLQLALAFVTSASFGTAFGAFIKTLSGETVRYRSGDIVPVNAGPNGNGNGNGNGDGKAASGSPPVGTP